MALREVELMFLLDNEWVTVDIDKNTKFSFNMKSADITKPTTTKVPFSYNVDLPKTRKNQSIFSNIEQCDAIMIRMNPIHRTEFRLYVNNNIFQDGYFGLELVTDKSYQIRLYGGLGDYFYGMSDTSAKDKTDMYLKNLDFGNDFKHDINRTFIKNSWDKNSKGNSQLDYFGYAMTYQGQYDNFDSDTIVNSSAGTEEATWQAVSGGKSYSSPVLNEHRKNTDVNGTVHCGHYVSYYQRPMIKLSKIFDKILDRMEDKGWSTVLDKSFFNESNPYWDDVWCILPQYSTDGSSTGTEILLDTAFTDGTIEDGGWNRNGSGDQLGTNSGKSGGNSSIPFDSSDRTVCNLGTSYENPSLEGGVNLLPYSSAITPQSYALTFPLSTINLNPDKQNNITVSLPFYLRWVGAVGKHDNRRWKSNNRDVNSSSNSFCVSCNIKVGGVSLPVYVAGGRNTVLYFNNSTCIPQNHARNHSWYNQRRGDANTNDKNTNNPSEYLFEGTIPIQANSFTSGEKLSIEFNVWGDTRWWGDGTDSVRGMSPILRLLKGAKVSYTDDGSIGIRSDREINYKDIVQSDETCFQFLRSYCNAFGMYFVKDAYRKTVHIMTRNTYYGNQEKVDWTNKIDYSKGVTHDIANFDYKIGLFKWRDTDSKYETDYFNKLSREYGSVRINTGYGFSDETADYFSDNIFSNAIIATGTDQYYLGRTNTMYQDNKTIPYLQDSSGDGISSNFILVFREFPRSVTNKPFLIADDNDFMLTYGYSWTGTSQNKHLSSYNYPTLKRIINKGGDTYSLYFGSPSVMYDGTTGTDIDTDGEGTIYKRFWADYFRDRFDRDTRSLTCYVNLSISDVQSDLFRKFIYINNTAWVLSKITGFNPLSPEPTKVELVKVMDINNYLSQKYISGKFSIQYGGDVIYDSETSNANPTVRLNDTAQTITFTFKQSEELQATGWSISDVEDITVNPMSSKSATTTVSVSLPANNTGSVVYHNIPVKWGNTTTTIQIVQVSNWTVSTTTNQGTSQASDGTHTGATIQVADSTSVTLTTSADTAQYTFGYWIVNGTIHMSQSVTMTVTENIQAQAVWFPNSSIGWTTNNINVGVNGGNITNHLNVPNPLSFTISDSLGMVTNPVSGNSSQDIAFTVPANTAFSTRTITVTATFNNGHTSTFTITQAGVVPVLTLSTNTQNHVGAGGAVTGLTLSTNAHWHVVSASSWLSATPNSGNAGNTQAVTVTSTANPTITQRTGTIVFGTVESPQATQALTVTQAGGAPTLSINPTTITVPALLNNFNIAVTSNASWTVTDNQAWISENPTSGTGNATVAVNVQANLLGNRQATITFSATANGTTVTATCQVSQTGVI